MLFGIILYMLGSFVYICDGSYDVDGKELEYLAHHLTDLECRQLVQSLHSTVMIMEEIPDGSGVPKNMSCIELLQEWDQKESRTESFVRMAERLRDLGHLEIAKNFSKAVFKDQEEKLKTMVLDPMSTKKTNTEKDERILVNFAEAEKKVQIADFDGRDGKSDGFRFPDWTVSQKVLFVISSVFTVGLFGFWFFHCIPDCVRSLCAMCCRKRQTKRDDATNLLLSEMEEDV